MAQPDGLEALATVANGTNQSLTKASFWNSSGRLDGLDDKSKCPPLNLELSERDTQTTKYTKSQLDEGDTLVFIKYPNDEVAYDITGFELRTKHIVHSKNLLATGSEHFIRTINSREQQLRLQRRFGLVGRLPDGIEYLLDLTPPEEGDEALAVTALLCCPLGVRQWYKSQHRCQVSEMLVGGKDEVTLRNLESRANVKTAEPATVVVEEDPPEYCPIRHRTGIERLLQAIEGKDPRLDSAPKVWTFAMLAHQYGCIKVVEDHVLSWMLTDPNFKFIEVLPEAALRLGATLENEFITRYAFSILVSEKALQLGAGNFGRPYDSSRLGKFLDNTTGRTRLGRRIDDIVDEDWTNSIEYAAQAFASRIHQHVVDLLGEESGWITALPEYKKISQFREFLIDSSERASPNIGRKLFKQADDLCEGLRDFVRGRLLRCIIQKIRLHDADTFHLNKSNYLNVQNNHYSEIYNCMNDEQKFFTRIFWGHIQCLDWAGCPTTYLDIDIDTRDYWSSDTVERQLQSAMSKTYRVRSVTGHMLVKMAKKMNLSIFIAIQNMGYNEGMFPIDHLSNYLQKIYGDTELEEDNSSNPNFNLTLDLSDAAPGTSTSNAHPSLLSLLVVDRVDHVENLANSTTDRYAQMSAEHISRKTADIALPDDYDAIINNGMFPADVLISETSVYFNLTTLCSQIGTHLQTICNSTLSKSEFGISTICDTIICLSDKEFAFLPLWAGGMNDGSGGVFATEVPFAERGGPIEPGPSYHTGSTLNSLAGSESEFDGESYSFMGDSSAGNTSLEVQNGEDDQLNRTSVVSEDEFSASEEDARVDTEVILVHRPAVKSASTALTTSTAHAGAATTHQRSDIEDENFFNAPDSDEWNMLDDDDDGEDTETED